MGEEEWALDLITRRGPFFCAQKVEGGRARDGANHPSVVVRVDFNGRLSTALSSYVTILPIYTRNTFMPPSPIHICSIDQLITLPTLFQAKEAKRESQKPRYNYAQRQPLETAANTSEEVGSKKKKDPIEILKLVILIQISPN